LIFACILVFHRLHCTQRELHTRSRIGTNWRNLPGTILFGIAAGIYSARASVRRATAKKAANNPTRQLK